VNPPSENPLRVGVVGVGHIGKNHARIYGELAAANPVFQFSAILDPNSAVATEIAAATGAKVASSLDEFAGLVDAASIATPTPHHFEIAKHLIAQGRHLLIEKPITETPVQARELVALAKSAGVILQVGHVERFNPALGALEKLLTRPRFIEAHRLSPYPMRSTEIGVVLDLMIHDLEVILHLVRSPVAHIDAVGVPVLSRGEDIANARLRFESGCVANITASRVSPETLRKIRVFQSDAYLSLDYQAQSGECYRLVDGAIRKETIDIERDEPLKRQLQSFLESARQGATPRVTGDQAATALALAVEITNMIAEQG
jgi:predicted dehydrogenase